MLGGSEMKKKIAKFIKKNYIWLILLLILLIVAIIFAFRGNIDKVIIKDHNLYQYTDGIKLEYTGEIMIDKENDEITQLSVKDVVMELGTDPIYYEDEMKVLFPKNMAVMFPLHGSQYKVNYRMDTPLEIAKTLKVKWDLGLDGGVLITNPIPEEYSLDESIMNEAIDKAIFLMNEQGIKGKDQTPFLLKTIVELTGGNSLESNIKLVFNNCKLAALIAKEYSNL